LVPANPVLRTVSALAGREESQGPFGIGRRSAPALAWLKFDAGKTACCFRLMKIVDFAFIAYPATDLARSRAFYEGILGLKSFSFTNDGPEFWVEYEVGPHTLGIGNEPFLKPSRYGAQLVFEVQDFDETIAHLRQHGVRFALEPFEMPRCRAAIIVDPDGNRIGIHQRNQAQPGALGDTKPAPASG